MALSETPKNPKQPFDGGPGVFEGVTVGAEVRLERQGSCVLSVLQGLELSGPVDNPTAYGRASQLAGRRVALHVFYVDVADQARDLAIAIGKRNIVHHRGIGKVPIGAQVG